MDTLVNEKVIASILDDNGFNAEIKALLNEIIDDELWKSRHVQIFRSLNEGGKKVQTSSFEINKD